MFVDCVEPRSTTLQVLRARLPVLSTCDDQPVSFRIQAHQLKDKGDILERQEESKQENLAPRKRKILILLPLHLTNGKDRLERFCNPHDTNTFHKRLAQSPHQRFTLLWGGVMRFGNEIGVESGGMGGLT